MYGSILNSGIAIVRGILIAVFSYISTNAVLSSNGVIPPLMYYLTVASCTVLAGYLLFPIENFSKNISVLLLWSAITAFTAYGLCLFHTSLPVTEWGVELLAVAVFITSYLLGSIHLMCNKFLKNQHITLCLVLTVVILFSSAPVWLGPLMYMHGQNEQVVNTIINISPLSYLALMADYDYLRSSWFYQNTPYGGLRYSYLTPVVGTAYYLLIIGLTIFASRRSSKNCSTREQQSFLKQYT